MLLHSALLGICSEFLPNKIFINQTVIIQKIGSIAISAAVRAGIPVSSDFNPQQLLNTKNLLPVAQVARQVMLQQIGELAMGAHQEVNFRDLILCITAQCMPGQILNVNASPTVQILDNELAKDFINTGLTAAIQGHLDLESCIVNAIGSAAGNYLGNQAANTLKDQLPWQTQLSAQLRQANAAQQAA